MCKGLRQAVKKAIKCAKGEAWDAARAIYSDPFIEIERLIDNPKAPTLEKPDHTDFHLGMLAALAIVALHDNETIYREIVESADVAQLVATARKDGAMRFSGLTRYGYGKKGPSNARPRTGR